MLLLPQNWAFFSSDIFSSKLLLISMCCLLQNEGKKSVRMIDGEFTIIMLLGERHSEMKNIIVVQSNNISLYNLFVLVSCVKMLVLSVELLVWTCFVFSSC
jgi:hypothetical protein